VIDAVTSGLLAVNGYFCIDGTEFKLAGLLGPLPMSPQAAKVTTAKTTNNN